MTSSEKTGLQFGRREPRGRLLSFFQGQRINVSSGLPEIEVNAGGSQQRQFLALTTLTTQGMTATLASFTVSTNRAESVTHLEVFAGRGFFQGAAVTSFDAQNVFIIRLDNNGTALREFILPNQAIGGAPLNPIPANGATTVGYYGLGRELRGMNQHEPIAYLPSGATINVKILIGNAGTTATFGVNWLGQAYAFA